MKVFAFSYFVVLVGVCLPGCRVHRQASLSTDLQENATRISHATRIHEDTVSVVSVATGSSSGIEWKYTETYYLPVPEDTVPKLKSRSWEGKRTSSTRMSIMPKMPVVRPSFNLLIRPTGGRPPLSGLYRKKRSLRPWGRFS